MKLLKYEVAVEAGNKHWSPKISRAWRRTESRTDVNSSGDDIVGEKFRMNS